MNKLPCNVIRDLLPSYADHICSKESTTLVEDHIKECPECKNYLKRISADSDRLPVKENQDFDYMKKVRKHIDLRSFAFMAFIFLTTAWFSSYSIRHGEQHGIFFTLLPLVLICNYFMFSQIVTSAKNARRNTLYLLGGIEAVITSFMLILMNVMIPKWVEDAMAGKIVLGMKATEIGPLIYWQLTLVLLLAAVIWCVTILLHIRGNGFPMVISCISIVIAYGSIYFRFLLKNIEDPVSLHPMLNRGLLLLGEGVLTVILIKVFDIVYKKKKMGN